MRIFLAGATGVIGRRLATLLRHAGHEVTGTTRTAAKTRMLRALGIAPIVVDVFDAGALKEAVAAARPDVVIHQLTDLPSAPGTPGYPAAQEANHRLRIEGTRNLMRAAMMAGVRRAVAQSIAFVYAPGEGARAEDDPLDLAAEGVRQLTVQGIAALEREVLTTPEIDGAVLSLRAWHLVRGAAKTSVGACRCRRARRAAGSWRRRRHLQYRGGRRRGVECEGEARTGLRSGIQDTLSDSLNNRAPSRGRGVQGHASCYGAFLWDPDGNWIEAVCYLPV
jgi:NAD(P)H-binding